MAGREFRTTIFFRSLNAKFCPHAAKFVFALHWLLAPVAQRTEQGLPKPRVGGSIPPRRVRSGCRHVRCAHFRLSVIGQEPFVAGK